jgi:hypothetical protein
MYDHQKIIGTVNMKRIMPPAAFFDRCGHDKSNCKQGSDTDEHVSFTPAAHG